MATKPYPPIEETPALGKNEVRIAYVMKKEDLARALVVLFEDGCLS